MSRMRVSPTTLRNGQKDHLRCHHLCMDERGLALSDLLETSFYLWTKFGLWLYSVLFCYSVISYVYILLSCNTPILAKEEIWQVLHMRYSFVLFCFCILVTFS